MNKSDKTHLKYMYPVSLFIDTSFYQKLSDLKLDELKLDEASIPLSATLDLDNIPNQSNCVPLSLNEQCFNCSIDSLTNDSNESDRLSITVKGEVLNFNRVDQLKTLDKQQFLYDKGLEVWEDSKQDINNCFKFFLVSFADLKKYRYTYWLMIPSFINKAISTTVKDKLQTQALDDVKEWFSKTQNRDKWVCVMDKNIIQEYNQEDFHPDQTIFIRDTSNINSVPFNIAKNILTVIKYHNPQLHELKVHFIRSKENKSFGYLLGLHEAPNKDDKLELKFTGWERNIEGKLAPRQIDLSSLIDPLKIAEQSMDLNLRLMKWRIVPELNLEIVKDTKVLLLGAGTLGCYVARALMGWGVRKITFVDNGTVSYSNLVRQPLFEFPDCGKPKAEVAAAALKRIFPLIDAKGENFSIPMIGHPITNESREHEEYDRLTRLIEEHDVVYLLMDSREARWLPTVISNTNSKMVINAALGFDSYLVMRHGIYDKGEDDKRLGCYFCNDVVVPTDSMTSKTLDQMCTVTRPGVAMMASSQAVELMVSLLQMSNNQKDNCILGQIPHQIRGFLDRFETLKVESPAYVHCSACSCNIVEACREEGWDFVKNVLDDNEYVEKMSGLFEIKQKMEDVMDDIVWMSEEDE
ncbi:ubiquitin-like modifier-activating enzyme Atg7p [Monosporozyma unispora]